MIVYQMVYTLLTNVSYTRGTFHGKDIYIYKATCAHSYFQLIPTLNVTLESVVS